MLISDFAITHPGQLFMDTVNLLPSKKVTVQILINHDGQEETEEEFFESAKKMLRVIRKLHSEPRKY